MESIINVALFDDIIDHINFISILQQVFCLDMVSDV